MWFLSGAAQHAGTHTINKQPTLPPAPRKPAHSTKKNQTPVHVVAPFDLRDTDAVVSLPSNLPAEFREVDILVNNAGLALGVATVTDQDLDDMRRMFETNVFAVVALTREVAKGMAARNRGHIVNVSSVAGVEAYATGGLYCASKHALNAFTTAARHELVGTDVRVTTVSPGACLTEFSLVRFKGDADKADAVYAVSFISFRECVLCVVSGSVLELE